MWQQNLFNNLLVFFILSVLFFIIWAKVTGKTLPDLINEVREAFASKEITE